MKQLSSFFMFVFFIGIAAPLASFGADESLATSEPTETPASSWKESTYQRALKASTKLKTLLQSVAQFAANKAQSTFNILQQKSACLINYNKCTKRDKLAISYAYGFTVGYGRPYRPLLNRLFDRLKLQIKPHYSQIPSLIARSMIAVFAQQFNLTGPLMSRPKIEQIGSVLNDYLKAKDKRKWVNDLQKILKGDDFLLKMISLIVITGEALSILKEVIYAVTYEKQFPLVSIARYIKMNTQCIWDEAYCKPEQNAEQRRIGLYFWLGYIQGYSVSRLVAPYTELLRDIGQSQGLLTPN